MLEGDEVFEKVLRRAKIMYEKLRGYWKKLKVLARIWKELEVLENTTRVQAILN